MENLSSIRGFIIVSYEEGKRLGVISAIYINPDSKEIEAFQYKNQYFVPGDSFFVKKPDVQVIGQDLVIVNSEKSVIKVSESEKPAGISLKELQGANVSTDNGQILGAVLDFDFDPLNWKISKIALADDKELEVNPDEVKLGDVVIVPEHYKDKVKEEAKKPGYLQKVWGNETFDEIKGTINKFFNSSKKENE